MYQLNLYGVCMCYTSIFMTALKIACFIVSYVGIGSRDTLGAAAPPIFTVTHDFSPYKCFLICNIKNMKS